MLKDMKRALRRSQAQTHMWRRLREDRQEHGGSVPHNLADCEVKAHLCEEDGKNGFGIYYISLATIGGHSLCACYYDDKAMARFKEQPKVCACYGCRNRRQDEGPTLQEEKALLKYKEGLDEYYSRDDIPGVSATTITEK